jgi:hypothetical protein
MIAPIAKWYVSTLRSTRSWFSRLAIGCGLCLCMPLFGQPTNVFPSSGNVGIGTTTPSATLQVNGTVTVGTWSDAALIAPGALWATGPSAALAFYNRGLSGYRTNPGDAYLWYNPDGTARLWTFGKPDLMAITSAGNVGIGTTAPQATLHVVGSMQLNGGGASTSLQLNSAAAHRGDLGIAEGLGAYAAGAAAGDIVLRTVSGKLIFDTSNGTTTPSITILGGNGNVGIGTTNPTSKLSVNGTIQAKEVVVNTGWADYVFAPAYRLRPLREVAVYIQQNHHLPDIPSEAEVKEKGVSIGDMQSKLLAKIEELTIHMIREHERNDRLEQKVQKLQEQNQKLREMAQENR